MDQRVVVQIDPIGLGHGFQQMFKQIPPGFGRNQAGQTGQCVRPRHGLQGVDRIGRAVGSVGQPGEHCAVGRVVRLSATANLLDAVEDVRARMRLQPSTKARA